MKTLSELIKELSSLPLGNVYKKEINGKTYYYHQYFLNNKRFSSIVKSEDLDNLIQQINKRKIIEKEIQLIRSKQKNIILSKSANELSGYLMCENHIVATFDKGNLISIDKKLAPLVVLRTHSIQEFLKLRTIDMSRTNARILKRVLNIHIDEDFKAALYSYALSISDNYWFKPKKSKIKYKDIEFKDDSYSDVSLKGDISISLYKSHLTPEITTLGSFEKGWRFISSEWWLYKSGTDKQLFAELLSYEFAKLISLKTATYEYDNGYIRSKNFADKSNFEPLASLLGDNDDYHFIFNTLIKISEDIAKEYLKLSFFDAVINNVDRHNENVGVMRNRKSGKIISLAPNFDNNLAFYSNEEITLTPPNKDGLIKTFISFLKTNKIAKELYLQIDFKDIHIEDIDKIITCIPIQPKVSKTLSKELIDRYYYLKDYFNNQDN